MALKNLRGLPVEYTKYTTWKYNIAQPLESFFPTGKESLPK